MTLGEAVAGAKVDVPTPRETVTLSIPPGTSSGAKLRVKGHGVVPKNGPPGDLLAEIQIVLPKQLSDADRKAIRGRSTSITAKTRGATCVGKRRWTSDSSRTTASGEPATFSGLSAGG